MCSRHQQWHWIVFRSWNFNFRLWITEPVQYFLPLFALQSFLHDLCSRNLQRNFTIDWLFSSFSLLISWKRTCPCINEISWGEIYFIATSSILVAYLYEDFVIIWLVFEWIDWSFYYVYDIELGYYFPLLVVIDWAVVMLIWVFVIENLWCA